MHIGFDTSQTGVGKAGCGYFADAMAGAMISIALEHRFSLYPSFGDSFFDYRMPIFNPYRGNHVHHGPRHLTAKPHAGSGCATGLKRRWATRISFIPTTSGYRPRSP
jgi:hypothetical protein